MTVLEILLVVVLLVWLLGGLVVPVPLEIVRVLIVIVLVLVIVRILQGRKVL